MANNYKRDIEVATGSSAFGGMLTGASAGASIGAAFGGIGSVFGGIIGGIAGLFTGLFTQEQKKAEYRGYRDQALIDRMEMTEQRNDLILSAKQSINSFRTSFDTTYGEGMYDIYDDLFSRILDLPSGTKTVSDLLEGLSTDNISGVITTSVLGENGLSEEALLGSISASDVNATYLQYMQETIRNSETAIGLQFQAQSYKETSYIRNYYDSIEQYNLQVAEQFNNAFLQQRANRISGETAMGEASTRQATSGIRQTGSGTNLTGIQQFQNDLSDAAYYSTLDYMIRQYEIQGNAANDNLIDRVYTIRNENAQITTQFTNDFFQSMNDYYHQLSNNYYEGIKTAEETIEEQNEYIEDLSEAIGDGKGTMEQYLS